MKDQLNGFAERTESFLSDCHGRDHITHAELAVSNDGTFLGFKNQTIANLGAYASVFWDSYSNLFIWAMCNWCL